MPKLMYISTSHNKGIYAATIVQCAASCKWLPLGSGLVDAFLTGLVDAWSISATRESFAILGELFKYKHCIRE